MENMVNYTNLFSNTYKGKKVLLTGHTGFKGTWMLYWLKILGAEIKGFSLPPSNNSLYTFINGNSLCDSLISDIRDFEAINETILSFQPDFIFHFAAQPLVRVSYQLPSETIAVNTLGTAYLMDSLRFLSKPCAVIVVTTDKVYQNKEWDYPYRESEPLGGYDPYSASKAAAEIIVDSFRNSFFNPEYYTKHKKAVATARAGNVIGGGDWSKDRLIPDIINALANYQPVSIRNPNSVRPWQHVLEPLGGYLLLGHHLAEFPQQFSKAFNFGPYVQDTLSVGEVVAKAITYWGSGEYIIPQLIEQPHEAKLLKLDISYTVEHLKWYPKYNADTAIQKTISFYKANFDNTSEQTKQLLHKQIEEFINS